MGWRAVIMQFLLIFLGQKMYYREWLSSKPLYEAGYKGPTLSLVQIIGVTTV
jgi:hypothetical protein